MTIVEAIVRALFLVLMGYVVMAYGVGGIGVGLQHYLPFVLLVVDLCLAALGFLVWRGRLAERIFSTVIVWGAVVLVVLSATLWLPLAIGVALLSSWVLRAAGYVRGWREALGVGALLPMLLVVLIIVVLQSFRQAGVTSQVLQCGIILLAAAVDGYFAVRRGMTGAAKRD